MTSLAPTREVVLIGAGHTHAHVMREWRKRPLPNARLTVVSPFPIATYSGMLPGTLAGLYEPGAMNIDLHRLTLASGARLIESPATGLDPARRVVQFADRPPLPYDVASIGIGSVPAGRELWVGHPHVVPIKPMQTFVSRLEELVGRVERSPARALRAVVVGGGAGGTEVAMCLRPWFARRGGSDVAVALVEAGDHVPAGYAPLAQKLARRALDRAGVTVRRDTRVDGVVADGITTASGETLPADVVVWVAGAAAPPELSDFRLPKTEAGFLAVDDTLRTTAGHDLFVVGDTATLVNNPVPKAGVYAVREGPVLWENLRRAIAGQPLRPYRPQRRFLTMLATGDGRAIGQYGRVAFAGRWVWRWKDRIDREFVRQYRC